MTTSNKQPSLLTPSLLAPSSATDTADSRVVVSSKKRGVPAGYTAVYGGRGGPLGNPFIVGQVSDEQRRRFPVISGDHARGEAIPLHRTWLDGKCQDPAANQPAVTELLAQAWLTIGQLAAEVRRGKKLALMCFCPEGRCHLDTVREFILKEAFVRGAP